MCMHMLLEHAAGNLAGPRSPDHLLSLPDCPGLDLVAANCGRVHPSAISDVLPLGAVGG